jgi:hypothetical protein
MKPRSQSKAERLRGDVPFAEGGTTRMFKPQTAGPDRPGNTGKDQTPAPGSKRASGGPRTSGQSSSIPARAGHAAPVRKGR